MAHGFIFMICHTYSCDIRISTSVMIIYPSSFEGKSFTLKLELVEHMLKPLEIPGAPETHL